MHIIYSACYISTNLHISWGPHSAYSSKLCLCWSESNHHGPINFGLRVIDGGPGGRDSFSFFKISIFISLPIFSLSDLWEKCSSSCPWHMLLFDCKSFVLPFKKKKKKIVLNVSKVEQLLWAFVDASTDGFYCYFVCSFYPIHVLVHLWLES